MSTHNAKLVKAHSSAYYTKMVHQMLSSFEEKLEPVRDETTSEESEDDTISTSSPQCDARGNYHRTCPQCRGSGEIDEGGYGSDYEIKTCSLCHGGGRILEAE